MEKVCVQPSRKCSLYLDLEFSRIYLRSLCELLSESLPPRTDQAASLEYLEPECIWEAVICGEWAGIGHAGPHSVRWSCVCERWVGPGMKVGSWLFSGYPFYFITIRTLIILNSNLTFQVFMMIYLSMFELTNLLSSSNALAIWHEELTYWKRLRCWERFKTKGEKNSRGWDG